MAIVVFNGKSYECSRAVKGVDYIKLYDENNAQIIAFCGISDFSGFTLMEGEWEKGASTDIASANAVLTSGYIKLTLLNPTTIETGLTITFRAPCDCTDCEGLNLADYGYILVDAAGSELKSEFSAFAKDALVSVILDCERHYAYIQNAAAIAGIPIVNATAISSNNFTATIEGLTTIPIGFTIILIPNKTNTTNTVSLDINGLGAIRILKTNSRMTGSFLPDPSTIVSGKPYMMTFNGSYWFMHNMKPSIADLDGVIPITFGGTGASNVEDALANLGLTSCIKIETRTYLGAGKSGASYPNTLTFSKPPHLLVVQAKTEGNGGFMIATQGCSKALGIHNGDTNETMINNMTWNGNTVTWHCSGSSQDGQLNRATEYLATAFYYD